MTDMDHLLSLPTAHYDVSDIVKFPPLSLSASSLTPLEKLYMGTFLVAAQPKIVVEFGVLKAVTTAYICACLEENGIDATVYGFDLPHQIEETRAANATVRALEASGRLVLVPGSLPESFTEWAASHNQQIDFALVDARHTFPHVTTEIEALWARLSRFGVILCHDYDENAIHDGVRYALDHFAQRTPDAQMCHLSTQMTNFDDLMTTADAADPLAVFTHVSTLAVLRKRPYDLREEMLAEHMNVPLDQLRRAQATSQGSILQRIIRKVKRIIAP